MLELRMYTINFQYDEKGAIAKVIVNFGTVGQGDTYISGNVSLSAEEFNSGNTIEQVKNRLAEQLQKEKEIESIPWLPLEPSETVEEEEAEEELPVPEEEEVTA